MKLNDYQRWAAQTSSLRDAKPWPYGDATRVNVGKPLPELPEGVCFVRVDHGAAGIASEAGEIAEHVKHVRFHGKALDRDHMIKEMGDLLWYLAELATGLGTTLEEVGDRNVAKLRARYPEGHFTVDRSENRNLARENEPDPTITFLERKVLRAAIGALNPNEDVMGALLSSVNLRALGMSDADLVILAGKLEEGTDPLDALEEP
jgi:NTP pyrophosphatase (non-canonical NTP hydrolase)